MDCETIEFDVGDDRVATITLNRPEALNTFNGQMAEELTWAWTTVREDDDIHVVVLQANGDRAFCAGIDLRQGDPWFKDASNPWNSYDPALTIGPKQQHRVWKPVVTAVHGICAGGGQYFVNDSDIIICADDAQFFDPHANGGMVSALEPVGMLARGVPLGDVLRWALMGSDERITAETALRLGLVTEVVPRDQLRGRARQIATAIAERETLAVQGTVRAIWEALDMTRSAALQHGMSYTQIGNVPNSMERPRINRTPTMR